MHMDTFLQNDRNVIVTENEREEDAQNLRVICVPFFFEVTANLKFPSPRTHP